MEVYLNYPKKFYDSQKDYTMAPEKIKIRKEWLSPSSLENANKFDVTTEDINKLVPNFVSKKNYAVYYGNFKYYLSKGLILEKVHKIL